MGAPSEGSEAMYRNPMAEVQRFFETRHPGAAKLYDLRGEKGAAYDADKFGGRVMACRFFDHNPAPLKVRKRGAGWIGRFALCVPAAARLALCQLKYPHRVRSSAPPHPPLPTAACARVLRGHGGMAGGKPRQRSGGALQGGQGARVRQAG
jgi:hypothetical protein